MRSYRDGDRIFQNSLVFIIFCYSFDNGFILSFLGNHYSLTFQYFGSLLMVINIKPQYVVRKIYCDPFSHVMDRCQYTRQLQQQLISFNTRSMHNSLYEAGRREYDCACTVAAMSTFSTCPPFLSYTSPPSWAPPSPVLSFLSHGNVVTFGAVLYGSVICLYV